MAVKFYMKGYKNLKKELNNLKKAPQTVLNRTEADIRSRGPNWIAQGVVERYNLGGSKNKGKAEIQSGKIGKLKIKGKLGKDMQLEYEGRYLTPVHFGMNPTDQPVPGTPYTMKWKVLRDGGTPMKSKIKSPKKLTKKQKQNIGRNFTRQSTRTSERSPWMLQHTRNAKTDGVNYIPFQRTSSTGRKMGHVAREVSLPQMVTQGKNGPMHPEVEKIFNANLEKRFDHYCDRYLK